MTSRDLQLGDSVNFVFALQAIDFSQDLDLFPRV